MIDPIARIQKLLALATDQAGTPEGEAAARMARALARRFALQADEARRRGDHDRDPILERCISLTDRALWRRRLSAVVASHGCCTVAWPRSGERAHLFGHRSSLLITEYLYAVLDRELTAARAAFTERRHREREARGLPTEEGRVQDLIAFTHSAISAVAVRLGELRREDQRLDPKGTALVLRRGDDVEGWLRQQGRRFGGSMPVPFAFDRAGYEVGNRIPLHDALPEDPGAPRAAQLGRG